MQIPFTNFAKYKQFPRTLLLSINTNSSLRNSREINRYYMVFRPYKLSLRQKITNQNKVQCRLAKVNFTKDVLYWTLHLFRNFSNNMQKINYA